MPPESNEDPDDDSVILVDAWRVPRGRCLACGSCSLWAKASGPFSHLNCGACKCKTTDHEDLSPWLREVLEHSTPSVESRVVSKGISLKAYTCWSPLATLFHLETDGAFSPMRDGREDTSPAPSSAPGGMPLCSVICPTTADRHAFHPLLYHCFCQQTYQPRELIVVDTGLRPSSFLQDKAKRDPSLVYRWFKDGRWTIGTKRNLACFLSRGGLIAHFDDDDLYAADYLSLMNQVILDAAASCETWHEAGLEGVKLAATLTSWHVFDTTERTFRFLHAVSDKWVYGWGFSYAFTREAWRRNFFPYRDIGEDFDFMMALRKLPGAKVLKVEDARSLCSHTYHPKLSISGGEKRKDGTQSPIGKEVPPPDPLVPLLPLLFEADSRALRDLGKRPSTNEEDFSYSIMGSWNGWSSFEDLHRGGSGRLYSATILIPNVPVDVEFQVFANRDWTMAYYPSSTGVILGPWRCPGANWKIQVPKNRNAISVSWDPSGEKKLVVQAVQRSAPDKPSGSSSGAPASKLQGQTPKTAKAKKAAPSLGICEALSLQESLIEEYKKEDFQRRLREIWNRTADDRVTRYQLRQDLCLPIQGPIIARFGFEPSRLGVAQTVQMFHDQPWATDQVIMWNNQILSMLTDADSDVSKQLRLM